MLTRTFKDLRNQKKKVKPVPAQKYISNKSIRGKPLCQVKAKIGQAHGWGKKAFLKWLSPIPVGIDDIDDDNWPVVIHPVRKAEH